MLRFRLRRRAARFARRQLHEAWECRGRLILLYIGRGFLFQLLLGITHLLSICSLRLLLWSINIPIKIMPWFRVEYILWSFLGTTGVGLVVQITILLCMWIWYRRAQARSDLPEPWAHINMTFVLQICAKPGLLSAMYWLWTANTTFAKKRWHFRHSLNVVILGRCIVFWATIGHFAGPLLLLTLLYILIVYETLVLLKKQVKSTFGYYFPRTDPPLEYWRHRVFAWATVVQLAAFIVVFTAILTRLDNWPVSALFILPITVWGTLLVSLLHGHDRQYLNKPLQLAEFHRSNTIKFCDRCSNTLLSRSRSEGQVHHWAVRNLRNSARAGCRICTTVWEQRSRISYNFAQSLTFWKPTTTIGYSTSICFKEDRFEQNVCSFDTRKREVADRWAGIGQNVDLRDRISLETLSLHTGSKQSLDTAVSWIQNCTIFHGDCAANYDTGFRPSRLLCVDNDTVCLHTTLQMPAKTLYLTLSHRWGSHRFIRLLEASVSGFQRGISWSELPKTFQDAITITRHLGFAYIWIDSLCIIQDSNEDWNREAKLMGTIYKNAQCNIAASDAQDSRAGCLYWRDPRAIQPERLDSDTAQESYLLNRTDIYGDHGLYTRGWVLQEALLARRTLDCGTGQLFWRCSEMRASEAFPGGVPTNIYSDDHPASKFKAISAEDDQVILNANIIHKRLRTKKTRSQIPRAPGKGSLRQDTSAPYAFWSVTMNHYTRMALTKDTDRPFAMVGIMEIFQPYFGEHWFGMWRIFLPLELLWTAAGRMRLPSSTRAPSWSWLSLEGPVSYGNCLFEYGRDTLLCQFLDAQAVGTTGMRLRLSAPLLCATCTETDGGRDFLASLEGHRRTTNLYGILEIQDYYGEVFFDQGNKLAAEEIVFCMPIQINQSDSPTVKGIVLQEVASGVYQRLGYFSGFKVSIPIINTVDVQELVLI